MAAGDKGISRAYADINFPVKYDFTHTILNLDEILSCDQLLAVYNVSITGITTTGARCPSIDQCSPIYRVGDKFQYGRIAYIFVSGDSGYLSGQTHGIITYYDFISTGYQWSPTASSVTGLSTNQGTGFANSALITSYFGTGTYAAKTAFNQTYGGYTWWLPSRDDYMKMTPARVLVGFGTGYYWSSSQSDASNAYAVDLSSSAYVTTSKTTSLNIMPIHNF